MHYRDCRHQLSHYIRLVWKLWWCFTVFSIFLKKILQSSFKKGNQETQASIQLMSLIHSQKYRPRITWKRPAFLWLRACSGGHLTLWVGSRLSCTSQTFSSLPTPYGEGEPAAPGDNPSGTEDTGQLLQEGEESRGGKKGRRMCRDLRDRKRLFALGTHEKKKSKFSAAPATSSSSLPPSPQRVAFPSSALLSHPQPPP